MSASRPTAVGGVRITEPATMATDFLIAIICFGFAVGVERSAASFDSPRGLWALSYAFTAIAALIGRVVHGFALYLGVPAKNRLWKATQYTMGVTSLAILAAAILAFVHGAAERWLVGAAIAKFVAYASAVRRRDDYAIVVADYGLSMIAVTVLAIAGWLRGGAPGAPWLVAAVVVSAIAASVQIRKIAPHPRFNHNDLYHVIQIVALYLFYRGGLLLVDG